MLVKSLILFCVVCCTSGAAIPTPFDPEKIIYEFAFDPNSELFTPISPETVKHVHGISEMDIQSYDVDGQEYKIHNDGGYLILEDILESSSPTSATEGTYKIGHESTIGYFLYPTTALASETHKIKNRLAGLGNAVEEGTVYRITRKAEYYYFYPSPHQYDPDILRTSTKAPSTNEASESTAFSQDISTQTSETPTAEAAEPNTSSGSPTISTTELNFSTSVTFTSKPAISATESVEPANFTQDTATPTLKLSTTEDVEPIKLSEFRFFLGSKIYATTKIHGDRISIEVPSASRPTISSTETVESRTSNPLPPTPKTPVLSPANPTAAGFAITIVVVIAIIVKIFFLLTILKEHFGINYFVSSKTFNP